MIGVEGLGIRVWVFRFSVSQQRELEVHLKGLRRAVGLRV